MWGGVVGSSGDDSLFIQNLDVTGQINAQNYVGGFIGADGDGFTVSLSAFRGTVSGVDGVGGVIGDSDDTPSRIWSTSVDAIITGTTRVGGLVGKFYYTMGINDSYVKGLVQGTGAGQQYIGGLVGETYYSGTMNRVYSAAAVTGSGPFVAGAHGRLCNQFTQQDSFIVGPVTGSSASNNISGFTGEIVTGCSTLNLDFTNTFYLNSNCTNLGGGLCNTTYGTAAADVTTFYSKLNLPLSNWDFNNIWQENVGNFPTLKKTQVVAPIVSHTCPTSVSRGSMYNCIIAVTDTDLNESRFMIFEPDHTCKELYRGFGFSSIKLRGDANTLPLGTCKVSLRITDGVNSSPLQSFDLTVNP